MVDLGDHLLDLPQSLFHLELRVILIIDIVAERKVTHWALTWNIDWAHWVLCLLDQPQPISWVTEWQAWHAYLVIIFLVHARGLHSLRYTKIITSIFWVHRPIVVTLGQLRHTVCCCAVFGSFDTFLMLLLLVRGYTLLRDLFCHLLGRLCLDHTLHWGWRFNQEWCVHIDAGILTHACSQVLEGYLRLMNVIVLHLGGVVSASILVERLLFTTVYHYWLRMLHLLREALIIARDLAEV